MSIEHPWSPDVITAERQQFNLWMRSLGPIKPGEVFWAEKAYLRRAQIAHENAQLLKDKPKGKLTITRIADTDEIVLISYQDDEHRILEVVWQKK